MKDERMRISPAIPHLFQIQQMTEFNASKNWLFSKYSSYTAEKHHPGVLKTNALRAEVISLLPDDLLHNNLSLPGCSVTQLENGLCYIALIRLPLEYCVGPRFGCYLQKGKWKTSTCTNQSRMMGACESFSSWTCLEQMKSSPSFGFDEFPFYSSHTPTYPSRRFCIELVSSSTIHGIFAYAKARVPIDDVNEELGEKNALDGACLREKSGIPLAGKITSFCGNPLFHTLSIDPIKKRIFFLESTYSEPTPGTILRSDNLSSADSTVPKANFSSTYGNENVYPSMYGKQTTSFSHAAARFLSTLTSSISHSTPGSQQKASIPSKLMQNLKPLISLQALPPLLGRNFADSSTVKLQHLQEPSPRNLGLRIPSEHPSLNASADNLSDDALNGNKIPAKESGRLLGTNYACISSISLNNNYLDATACKSISRPSSMQSLPIHIYFDRYSLALTLFSYDASKRLVVTVLDSSLNVKYSARINHVQSGWVIPPKAANKDEMIIVGDAFPYGRVINTINFVTNLVKSARTFD
ncbi:hypothetical protein IE077_001671 [Cardiosporidium cionae]|uniref:Uncharacterized protein n=1 Tax=Cardiosporidium cionae TaxID=476202 RepID=A0ABQ7JCJ3_9APIC|nr:hypothetical protein IE077_001671 [Cardiosporidium cionae]|eukprot:KAF8821722.1 hypothetical protein IE077_001671 [Cardiosporidium cionae]